LSAFRVVLVSLYVIAFVAVAYFFYEGASFYRTPLLERAHHEGYWVWKSGGTMGKRLGTVGSSMMVLMLLYSVRKRVPGLRKLGQLSRWLDIHIFLGVIGPLLVVLHSAFKVHGLVALSFWSMIAVAGSGVLGRYLYLQIPRNRAGEALNLAELERLDQQLSERLRSDFRLDAGSLQRLDALTATPKGRQGLLTGLVRILIDDVRLRGRLKEFARGCRGVPRPVFRDFEQVVRQKAQAHRRLMILERVQELFHYWHVIHKPFAVVMYLFMVVHVVVALMTGYGWS